MVEKFGSRLHDRMRKYMWVLRIYALRTVVLNVSCSSPTVRIALTHFRSAKSRANQSDHHNFVPLALERNENCFLHLLHYLSVAKSLMRVNDIVIPAKRGQLAARL